MNKQQILETNQRYETKVKNLFDYLGSYSNDQLNHKPKEGAWSALQNLHHLILAEETSLRYVQKKLSFNPTLAEAGLAEKWRGFMLWAYLSTPFKFKAPAAVGDEQLPEFSTLAEAQTQWMKVRKDWDQFFQDMPETLASKSAYKHLVAGKLGWEQMFIFFNTHFDRHLNQVKNTLANPSLRITITK